DKPWLSGTFTDIEPETTARNNPKPAAVFGTILEWQGQWVQRKKSAGTVAASRRLFVCVFGAVQTQCVVVRRDLAICSLLGAILLALYWPVRHHDFVSFDDPLFITQNPYVRVGLTLQSIRYACSAIIASNWHPVTTLSHILDCQFFGVNPG